jgi:hypothetical protein
LISLARRADARTEQKDVKDPDLHG